MDKIIWHNIGKLSMGNGRVLKKEVTLELCCQGSVTEWGRWVQVLLIVIKEHDVSRKQRVVLSM